MQTVKMVLYSALIATLFSGCALFQKKPEDITVRIYEEAEEALPAESRQTVEIPHTDMRFTISPFPQITERDIESAQLYSTAGGKAIFLRLDAHGVVLLDEMTTRDRGKHVIVMINNHPVSAWLVNERILNGQFLVEGEFTDAEAKKIVDDLNLLSKKNDR